MEDKDIVSLYWARDERAIQETAKVYDSFCHSISFHILGNHKDAEECVNDTWLRVWNVIPPERPQHFKGWIAKITRNLSINKWKSDRRRKRFPDTDILIHELDECIPAKEDIEQTISQKELAVSINRWLSGLAPQDRILFVQRYWFGTAVKEIAKQNGDRPNTVSKRLFDLRKQLGAYLESEDYV